MRMSIFDYKMRIQFDMLCWHCIFAHQWDLFFHVVQGCSSGNWRVKIINHDGVLKWRRVHVTGSLRWNPPVIGGFPSQRASNADIWCFFNVSPKNLSNQHWRDRWSETPRLSCDLTVSDANHNRTHKTQTVCINIRNCWVLPLCMVSITFWLCNRLRTYDNMLSDMDIIWYWSKISMIISLVNHE